MKRRRISAKERLAIFARSGGRCHLCGGPVSVGQAWEVSHDTPLELGGADRGDNLKPAHKKCHAAQTAQVDVPAIAKAKRREAAHIGARLAPVRPIKSAPFPVSERTAKREPKTRLPPRNIYEAIR